VKERRVTKSSDRRTRRVSRTHSDEFAHLLAQAVEASADLIAMADLDGHFIFSNRAMLQAGGYEKDELIGNHFEIVLAAHNPPALLREIGENLLTEHGWKGECIFTRRDAGGIPIFLSVGPVKGQDGHPIGSFGIARDISERQRVNEALRESEEQFRQLAENIREVFFVSAPNPDRVLYVSPAYDEIWGRPREEIYERPAAWIESIHMEDRDHAVHNFAQSQLGVPTNIEYRIVRPDGSLRWINNRTFPVRDSNGKFCRVVGIAEDITARKQEESELRTAHEKMNLALRQSERLARDAVQLTELVDILQSCQTVDEAYKVTGDALPSLVASRSGALCITSPSRNVVEVVVSWGGHHATEKTFAPDACWALRRGKIHLVADSSSPLRCAHVNASLEGGHLCVPLAAQGETLGVLYCEGLLAAPDPAVGTPESQCDALGMQARAVGERISLALANLRLREVLRSQSIRDPLTGLFNRRYMEESLERELRRADRNKQPVALIMLDIDRFKQFNDLFGHQAGDALLRALGDFLLQRTRGQDVACRYGGEEFALILASAAVDAACKRIEILRQELKQLTVQHAGQMLGRVTFSIGIASYPGNATTPEELLRAADRALYQSKREGRDRVTVA
jgi:diguanylate cyclase (GGDEF)-like protein/PAS domain S-box-containing protein